MDDRRTFLRRAAAAAALPLLPACRSGKARAAGDPPAASGELARAFARLGYDDAPELAVLTGEAFNGGLRYEDEVSDVGTFDRMRVQRCGRVEDLARARLPCTLAGFHMLGLYRAAPDAHEEVLSDVLTVLTGDLGIPPARLHVVATPRADVVRPLLSAHGVDASRVHVRPLESAFASRSGSGWFDPPGHPRPPRMHSLSLHYRPGEVVRFDPLPGDLTGTIEVGELMLPSDPGETAVAATAGLGVERVAMALGTPPPTFEQSRRALLAWIEDEASARAVPLPPGYAVVAGARG